MIITLCGSTKFKTQFLEQAKRLTLLGDIVLMPHVFMHDGDFISDEQKEKLDELHKQKIDLSDGILVLNINGYIGNSTKSEIKYAKKHDKTIMYLEEV